MTTIINTSPNQGSDEGLSLGLIVGIILVGLTGFLVYMYGIPFMGVREEVQPTAQKIEIQVPVSTPVVTTPSTEPVGSNSTQ